MQSRTGRFVWGSEREADALSPELCAEAEKELAMLRLAFRIGADYEAVVVSFPDRQNRDAFLAELEVERNPLVLFVRDAVWIRFASIVRTIPDEVPDPIAPLAICVSGSELERMFWLHGTLKPLEETELP